MVCNPQENDILFGRGKGNYNHIGNMKFHEVIRLHKEEYLSGDKCKKTKITKSIVRAIRSQTPPGRFLARDSDSDTWIEVPDKKAHEKTSQALREYRKSYVDVCKKKKSKHNVKSEVIQKKDDKKVTDKKNSSRKNFIIPALLTITGQKETTIPEENDHEKLNTADINVREFNATKAKTNLPDNIKESKCIGNKQESTTVCNDSSVIRDVFLNVHNHEHYINENENVTSPKKNLVIPTLPIVTGQKEPIITEENSEKLNTTDMNVSEFNATKTNLADTTKESQRLEKKQESMSIFNDSSVIHDVFLNVHNHENYINENEKIDLDELNYLIYQTFCGMGNQN